MNKILAGYIVRKKKNVILKETGAKIIIVQHIEFGSELVVYISSDLKA